MRTKTKYREFKDGGRVQAELPPEPITTPSAGDPPPAPAVEQPAPEPQPAAPESLIPSPAEIPGLQRQLDALRQSESIQQQQQAIADIETRRTAWVRGNPLAQKFANHLGAFHHEALKVGPDTSPAYFAHMENQLAALQAQEPPPEATKMPPKVFAPQPAPESRSSFVSAPVSREVPGAGGRRPPGKVTLTPAEVEAAKVAGISVEEYALQLQKYKGMLASGEYRDNRENR